MSEFIKKLSDWGYTLKEEAFFFPPLSALLNHGHNDCYHYVRHRVDIVLTDISHFASIQAHSDTDLRALAVEEGYRSYVMNAQEEKVCVYFTETLLRHLDQIVMPWDKKRLLHWLASWCEELNLPIFVHTLMYLKLGAKDYRWLLPILPDKTKWDLVLNMRGKVKRDRLMKSVEWNQWRLPYSESYIPVLFRTGRLTFDLDEQRFTLDGKKVPFFWNPYVVHLLYLNDKKYGNESAVPLYELLLAQYHFPATDHLRGDVHGYWIRYPFEPQKTEAYASVMEECPLLA